MFILLATPEVCRQTRTMIWQLTNSSQTARLTGLMSEIEIPGLMHDGHECTVRTMKPGFVCFCDGALDSWPESGYGQLHRVH